MIKLFLLLVLICDGRRVNTMQVDLVEVNHTHDADGKFRFTQIIAWNWSHDYRRYDVVTWWMPNNLSEYQSKNGMRIIGQSKRQTWTNYDPEVRNRDLFPCDNRDSFDAR